MSAQVSQQEETSQYPRQSRYPNQRTGGSNQHYSNRNSHRNQSNQQWDQYNNSRPRSYYNQRQEYNRSYNNRPYNNRNRFRQNDSSQEQRSQYVSNNQVQDVVDQVIQSNVQQQDSSDNNNQHIYNEVQQEVLSQVQDLNLEEESTCVLCCEKLEIVSIGECNHQKVCALCTLRLRLLTHNNKCPLCNQVQDKVILMAYRNKLPNFEDIEPHLSNADIWFYKKGWADGVYVKREKAKKKGLPIYVQLLRQTQLCCPICVTGRVDNDISSSSNESGPQIEGRVQNYYFKTLAEVIQHLKSQHHQRICQTCFKSTTKFCFEMGTYNNKELTEHQKKEHEFCEYCGQYFYSVEELYKHMTQHHFTCYVCEQIGIMHQFFKDHRHLKDHLRNDHFLCPNPDCTECMIAFSSEQALRNHTRLEHNSSVNQQQAQNEQSNQIRSQLLRNTRQTNTEGSSNNQQGNNNSTDTSQSARNAHVNLPVRFNTPGTTIQLPQPPTSASNLNQTDQDLYTQSYYALNTRSSQDFPQLGGNIGMANSGQQVQQAQEQQQEQQAVPQEQNRQPRQPQQQQNQSSVNTQWRFRTRQNPTRDEFPSLPQSAPRSQIQAQAGSSSQVRNFAKAMDGPQQPTPQQQRIQQQESQPPTDPSTKPNSSRHTSNLVPLASRSARCACGRKIKRIILVGGQDVPTLPCDEECEREKRNKQLAEAFGITNEEEFQNPFDTHNANMYKGEVLLNYLVQPQLVGRLERQITEFMEDKLELQLEMDPQSKEIRELVHIMAESFNLETKSIGKNEKRRVVLIKNQNSAIPYRTVAKQVAKLSTEQITELKNSLVLYVLKIYQYENAVQQLTEQDVYRILRSYQEQIKINQLERGVYEVQFKSQESYDDAVKQLGGGVKGRFRVEHQGKLDKFQEVDSIDVQELKNKAQTRNNLSRK